MHTDIEDLQIQAASEEGIGVSAVENTNAMHDCNNIPELMISEFCSKCKRPRFGKKKARLLRI